MFLNRQVVGSYPTGGSNKKATSEAEVAFY